MHVLAHSHWDREWYQPAPRFRQRLLALVEQLLQHPPHASRPFLLDGQAVVLEDVLRVRPELRPRLELALQSGSIEAGPWYVLADELIPSGEALVRNLLAGRAVLQSFGAQAPAVCYSPDAFGHTAALPLLAQGFGLPVAVVWRGYGSARWPAGDAARWTSADGSSVLLWHLPPDGYEYARMLPTHAAAAADRWKEIEAVLAPRCATNVVLLTNGADHHALQPDLDQAVESLRQVASRDGHTVIRSSLGAWAAAFSAAAQQRALPTVTGELRDSYGSTWTLQGTFATRAHQKRAVAQVDALLRNDVEPWVALARMAPCNSPRETARARTIGALTTDDLASLLQQTWRTFLRVLPHDTLCGCSVDEVARALDHRVQVVRAEAMGLREAAIDLLLGRDAVQARGTERSQWQPRLVLRNRSARVRYGVAEIELVQTLRDVAVGPGSGGRNSNAGPKSVREPTAVALPAELSGGALAVQALHQFDRYDRRESPQHYPDNDLVRVTRALAWVPREMALGGYALRTMALGEVAEHTSQHTPQQALHGGVLTNEAASEGLTPVTVTRRGRTATLQNGLLSLTVGPRSVELHDLLANRRITQLVQLTWQADRGDTYTAAPRGNISSLKPVRARVVARGPLRAGVAVTYALRVRRHPFARGSAFTVIRVTLRFLLDAGASFLRVHAAGFDAACDHRLRIAFATGVPDAKIVADAAFGPVTRVPLDRTAVDESHEHVTTSAPLHQWVAAVSDSINATVSDSTDTTVSESINTTVVSDGLAEYEALAGDQLAVTLVRATGALSRASLPERPGHAGWPAPVPEAQGRGRFAARFAIAPGGAFDAAVAYNMCEDVLRPLIGHTWRDAPAAAPAHVAGVTLSGGAGVVASAVKPAEDGDGVVLRCVNVHEHAHTARWDTPWAKATAVAVSLDETVVAARQPMHRATDHGASAMHQDEPDVTTARDSTSASVTVSKRAVSTLRVSRP